MDAPREANLRARLGRLVERIYPGAADRAFTKTRDREVPDSRMTHGRTHVGQRIDRPPHLIVVPQEGPHFESWRPGTRNFYYEAFQSARERWGSPSVTVMDVAPGELPATWVPRLVDLARSARATHIVTHLEHDPSDQDAWNWDVAWSRLIPDWDGVLLGVMFDSAFPIVRMKARRLARMSSRFVAVDICEPMDGVLIRRRNEIGPVTMPMSHESLALVRERITGISATSDVSFIGAMYPYRVELIHELRAMGVDVAVNPHRRDVAEDFASSRTEQPGWLDYMAGLAGSRMTLNFSRSSAGDTEQYKTRVIEALLAGTFLLTDDRHSTSNFFVEGSEYASFRGVSELTTIVPEWLADSARLDAVRLAGQARAWEVAPDDFWQRIDAGLLARELPELGSRRSGEASES